MKKAIKLKENEISISRFVREFVGVDADCSNLYHKGLKSLESPLIIGISNDTADKCPELLAKGDILKVRDARGHLGTYVNPRMILDYATNIENKETHEKTLKTIRVSELKELDKLYDKVKELKKTIKKIDKCLNVIKSVSNTDEEEIVKIKQLKKCAKRINNAKKLINY